MTSTSISKLLLATVAAGALAACDTSSGSSTVDPVVVPEVPEDDGPSAVTDVTMGTTDLTGNIGSNNLRFANGQAIDFDPRGDILPGWGGDSTPTTLTLSGAIMSSETTYPNGGDSSTTVSSKLIDLDLTLRPIFVDGDRMLQVIADTGDDQAVFIIDPLDFEGGGYAESQGGVQYYFAIESAQNLLAEQGFFSDSDLYLVIAGGMGYGASEEEFTEFGSVLGAWIGLETAPAVIGAKAYAEYDGVFNMLVAAADGSFATDIEGGMYMGADFANGEVEGEMYSEEGYAEFEGIISGNGFSAAVTEVDSDFFFDDESAEPTEYALVGDIAQIDGVFYGVNGEEAAGTILVDTEVTGPDGTVDVVGGGVFVLGQDAFVDN